MISNIPLKMRTNEEMFCVEAYILTKYLDETERRFFKRFHVDHRKIDRAPEYKFIQ